MIVAPLAAERPSQPYPGLRPFEAHEWSIFFGRERMVDDVIDRLARDRLVVVHGASGSGKSSLIRAGVMPKLARQHVRHGAAWLTCAMRPSGGPLWNLATEFAKLEGRGEDLDRIGTIQGLFNRRGATLASVAGALEGFSGKSLCVLVDQFEELFRYEKETSREEAELFVELVGRAASTQDGEPAADGAEMHVVVTMRSEFLGECARFDGLAETINRTQYLVPRMDDDALMRAVQRPAQMYDGSIDEALAARLIASVRGREDELPLLQHGLMLMWDEAVRTRAGERIVLDGTIVEKAGGLAELLSGHADRVMDAAAPDARRARLVESMFRELTDVNAEGSAIRRPRAFRDLAVVAGATTDEMRPLIDAFRASGVTFLTPYSPAPLNEKTVIDISHEALIRCWRRIASPKDGWLKREFDDGLAWRSLLVEAKAYGNNPDRVLSAAATEDRSRLFAERGEAWSHRYGGGWPLVGKLLEASRAAATRARRWNWAAAIALTALTIGAVAASIFSFTGWSEARRLYAIADEQKSEALKEKGEADNAKAAAEEAKELADVKRTEAEAEKERADENDKLERMFVDGFLDIGQSRSPDTTEISLEALEKMRVMAEHGNDVAAKMMAIIYYKALNVQKDYPSAIKWYTLAAEKKNVVAMRNLGDLYEAGDASVRDYSKAREWFEKAADAGDPIAMRDIGLLYFYGNGVNKDLAEAFRWYEKASAAGDTEATRVIGFFYQSGQGVTQDYGKAREWYEKAAAAGNGTAMIDVGLLYQNGQGVPQDYAQASEWFEKAAGRGNTFAMRDLGFLFERPPTDYAQALIWFEKAAERGDSDAMRQVGFLYQSGKGAPQDSAKALDWYQKAAAANNLAAMIDVGNLYRSGQGVPQDYALAQEWFEKAADRGNTVAMRDLGQLFEQGHGVPQDPTQAYIWYKKAADHNDAEATRLVGLLYQSGIGVAKDSAKTLEWLGKSAAAGNITAMINLGNIYKSGADVPQDYGQALSWFGKAADRGNTLAMRDLALLFEQGAGVQQDFSKARGWYEKAAATGDAEAARALVALDGKTRRTIAEAHAQGRFAEALRLEEDWARSVEADETKKAGKAGPLTAQELGNVSWAALFAHDFQRALDAAERAHSLDPAKLRLETNDAHALMFLDRTEEARALYFSHKDEPVSEGANKPWREVIAEDFVEFRKAGLVNSLMEEVETAWAAKSP
jgi:TPR repeat protein